MTRYRQPITRPDQCRLNRAHPLAGEVALLGIGGMGCVGSAVFPDASLFGNHGTLTNMDPATDWVFDPYLQRWVLDFDGSNDYILLPFLKVTAAPQTITFVAWINTTNTANEKRIWSEGTVYGQLFDVIQQSTGYIRLRHNSSSGNVNRTGTIATNNGAWHHVAGWCSGDAIGTFVNGQVDLSGAITPGTIAGNATNIGREVAGGATYFPGQMADCLAFTRVLSLPEIRCLADPSNVLLEVGNTPLILPERRVMFPAAVAGGATASTWLWSRQHSSQVIGGGAL